MRRLTGHRPAAGLVVACTAVLLALTGTGIAQPVVQSATGAGRDVARALKLSKSADRKSTRALAIAQRANEKAKSVTGQSQKAGPQGPPGPQGPNGLQGLPGFDGAAADTGATGTRGATGATGATGTTGLQGATGAKGATGPAGPQNVTLFEQESVEAGATGGNLATVFPFTLTASCVDDAGSVTGEVVATTSADGSFVAGGDTGTDIDSTDPGATVFTLDAAGGTGTFALVAPGTDVSGTIWGRVVSGSPPICVFGGFAAGTTP